LLEATIPASRDDGGREARRERVTAAIDRIESDDFGLHFDIEEEGPDSPPMRDVRRRVQRWLASLDWDTERAALQACPDASTLPRRQERVDDWVFSFLAWPLRPEDRGTGEGAIWAGPSDGGVFDHAGTLRDRLEAKAKKYGPVDEPVVLAVRLDGMGAADDDIESALYGPTIGVLDRDRRRVIPTDRRGAGLWWRDGASRNQHVVGVLAFSTELRPWSVETERPALWLHPTPAFAVPAHPFDVVRLGDGSPRREVGTFAPGALFARS
jgi:hypothetical protein